MATPDDLPPPTHEPSLKNVIDQTSLRWVFVGGKGGVGKTTCASSLAVQLARVRRSVLVISTDPAHNLSDAFRQKLTKQPALVNGFDNLYAMEVDPTLDPADLEALDAAAAGLGGGAGAGAGGGAGGGGGGGGFMAELAGSIPGIDEAMSFAEVMKQVQSLDHDVIVFDTAPTGHTLRLLNFPTLLEKGLGKLQQLRQSLGGAMTAVSRMMGAGAAGGEDGDPSALPPPEAVLARLDDMLHVVQKVNSQFQDPALTTFVCVCIPEFLSLYETERLVQELAKFGVDTRNVVVNQLLFPDCAPGVSPLLDARVSMQQKYLRQFYDLYDDDFHVTRLPLLREEVRGAEALKAFGQNLVVPYVPPPRPESEEDAVAQLRTRVKELEEEVAELKKK